MTTTVHTTAVLDCPIWCTSRDNGIHRAGEDDLTIRRDGRVIFRHHSPTFGEYFATGADVDILTGEMSAWVFPRDDLGDREVDDDEKLRQLAMDATTAHKWLEAHQ
ncbi:hypothetical protein [Nocardioides sp. MH1]|uniref:hypothetical protein n=1 Tax=Nocardioides sp. MH1 TaxID=3242490 RepID=UPI003521CFA1